MADLGDPVALVLGAQDCAVGADADVAAIAVVVHLELVLAAQHGGLGVGVLVPAGAQVRGQEGARRVLVYAQGALGLG